MFLPLLVLCLTAYGLGDPIWVENFDNLDRNDWFIEIVKYPHNNELQYYTDHPENIRAENGNLVITPLKEYYDGKQYTSGRMHSNFAWKFGRVEVRAKLPKGYGLWPAIWMMPRDSKFGGWPTSGEIDIMEARGQNTHEFASTIHYGICCDNHYYETSGDLPHQCNNDQYHVYSVDWTPTKLVYRFDGKAYFEQSLDRVISWMYTNPGDPFNEYFYLILNVAVGGHYLDDPKPDTVWDYPDAQMLVDYVKVYPIEDIATYKCQVNPNANPSDVCGNINWACNSQNYADVSAECTWELTNCCASPTSCDPNTLYSLASALYASYDSQVNDAESCDFGGTAKRYYELNDGGVDGSATQCLIRDSANNWEICGSMQWTCYEQNYADVSSACAAGSDVLSCCGANPDNCNNNRLREGAQLVFQSYYNQIPQSSSCDFGGICYLDSSLFPLECTDGYGA